RARPRCWASSSASPRCSGRLLCYISRTDLTVDPRDCWRIAYSGGQAQRRAVVREGAVDGQQSLLADGLRPGEGRGGRIASAPRIGRRVDAQLTGGGCATRTVGDADEPPLNDYTNAWSVLTFQK